MAEPTKSCAVCGATNRDSVAFCTQCGTRFDEAAPPSQPPPLLLEVRNGDQAGRTIPVTGVIEVGREDGLTLTLDDEYASRRHARISASDEGVWLEDLTSRNGTFVNGARIEAPTTVRAGDEILIGDTLLVLTEGR